MASADYSQRAGAVTYIGSAVVTCLEIRCPPVFRFSGPAPSRYSQPKALAVGYRM